VAAPLITLMTGAYTVGIGRNLARLANALYLEGIRVDILVDRPVFPYADSVTKGVNIKHLRTSHRIGGIPHLLRYLKRNKPAVVLTPFVQLTTLAIRTRSLSGGQFKVFANIRSTYSVDFANLKERRRRKRIQSIKRYYPMCDGLIAVSEGAADDFSRITDIPRNSIDTIYNPVVSPDIAQRALPHPEHPWFKPGYPPVILGVGRLTKQKNFHLLLDAFDIARSRMTCRLMIFGEGEERNALERRISQSPHAKDISMPGFEPNPFPYLKAASLFVLSSSWEGLPTVLIEAMALGTPVVSTDCPSGPREILTDNRLGTPVPMDDPDELALAMIGALKKPASREVLMEGSKKFQASEIARLFLARFGIENR
jgi:glycosyltransferase involved in cell wall biosynthesis